jgi:predicted regulator of Ras-like GTPase activity (Roadblock/LC7/MglB family)
MSFADILNQALEQVRGAQFAGVVSADGLGVDVVTLDTSYDPKVTELELSEVAAALNGAAQRMSSGSVRDFLIEAEHATYVASQVMPGYYAVIGIEPETHLGRARFAAKQMAQRLQNEL